MKNKIMIKGFICIIMFAIILQLVEHKFEMLGAVLFFGLLITMYSYVFLQIYREVKQDRKRKRNLNNKIYYRNGKQ